MENNNLLKKLQDYFKTVKEDFSFMKNEIAFTEAIKYLDSEKLKELVNNGFNISEYEKENGSIKDWPRNSRRRVMARDCKKCIGCSCRGYKYRR